MAVRRGEPALSELIDELHAQAARRERAAPTADLPDAPDAGRSIDSSPMHTSASGRHLPDAYAL